MALTPNRKHKYLYVEIKIPGGRINKRVHIFVLETFAGPRPEGMECRHINGFRTDNRIENLAWGTRSQNMEDARRHGTLTVGSLNGCAKLTESDIPEIRASNLSQAALSKFYGVSSSVICEIINHKAWKHI